MIPTPKQRMLNAYKNIENDRPAVAPEFWTYYPAKFLNIPMIEFEREITFSESLKKVFEHYSCEGWGLAFPKILNENLQISVHMDKMLETTVYNYKGNNFRTKKMYSKKEPCWLIERLAQDITSLNAVVAMLLDTNNTFDYDLLNKEHKNVGESYLLEVWCGVPFFDFIADLMGFENAVMYFADAEESKLIYLREQYTKYQLNFIDLICKNTNFESFMIGCSYSCNSLIGKDMWRKWDKPYIESMCERIHQNNRLLHIHFHGKSMDCAEDFAQIGIDCVCPFERGAGGDISNLEDLKRVRNILNNKVTFNGNIHTIDTLIFGDENKVKNEVKEVLEAFKGSNRFIVGSGDQVGGETPPENIWAMIHEVQNYGRNDA